MVEPWNSKRAQKSRQCGKETFTVRRLTIVLAGKLSTGRFLSQGSQSRLTYKLFNGRYFVIDVKSQNAMSKVSVYFWLFFEKKKKLLCWLYRSCFGSFLTNAAVDESSGKVKLADWGGAIGDITDHYSASHPVEPTIGFTTCARTLVYILHWTVVDVSSGYYPYGAVVRRNTWPVLCSKHCIRTRTLIS